MTTKFLDGVLLVSTAVAFINSVYFFLQQEYVWFGIAAVSLALGIATCLPKAE